MNEYTVTMGLILPEGSTEDDVYDAVMVATKHSALQWWIEGDFKDHGKAEGYDCD